MLLLAKKLSCQSMADQSILEEKNTLIEKKIDSLMMLMTLQEKIGQTVLYSSTEDVTGPVLDKNYQTYLRKGQIGAIFNAMGSA